MEDNLDDVFQMSQQMRALHDFYKLSNLDTRLRFLACRQLELALSGLFPQAEVVPFGSSVNTFGANTTDLDMIVNFASVRNFSIFQSRLFQNKASLVTLTKSGTHTTFSRIGYFQPYSLSDFSFCWCSRKAQPPYRNRGYSSTLKLM